MTRVVIIAGEASGDRLGASFIRSARRRYPDLRVEGIAGPLMREAGCDAWFDSQELAVMGLAEVLKHLPRILRIRREVLRRLRADPPDVLLGIDAPDFNLPVEKAARRAGILTVHYVCPSVWAWRERRVNLLRAACDRILCLLPFEPDFLARHGVAGTFVGHPLADEIPMNPDQSAARQSLGIDAGPVVGLLPGSRVAEVERIGPVLIDAARWLTERVQGVRFVVPAATSELHAMFRAQLAARAPEVRADVLDGQAHAAIAASDVVMLVSGTASLEVMLSARPMVVAYKMSPVSYTIARFLTAIGIMNVRFISLPNLLADRMLVPELIQHEATAEAIGRETERLLDGSESRTALLAEFNRLHEVLRCSAGDRAAQSVMQLLSDETHRSKGPGAKQRS